MRDILKAKRRAKVTKGVLFLYNAPAHRALATQKKRAYMGAKKCTELRGEYVE
jgi:hypothetical protein